MAMEGMGIVAICQFGGEFITNSDRSMSYTGGEAHAIDIDPNMLFDDFKAEITSVFHVDVNAMTIKYFLPNNNRTLITVSCDKDLKHMISFNANSVTIDVYILAKPDNRTTVADSGTSTDTAVKKKTNAGRPKQASSGMVTGRVTRSRTRLANSVVYDIPPVAVLDNRLQRQDAAESADISNVAVNSDAHTVSAPAFAYGAPQYDPFVANDVETGEYRIPVADSSDPGAVSAATADGPIFPCSPTLDDIITGVGQEFENVKDFRDKLCKYAINKGFMYKFVKNDPVRVTVRCSVDSCPWRMHASQSFQKKRFVIKKLNNVHTCEGGVGKGQRRVTKKWLVSILKEKLRDNPEYKPKDIARDIYQEYGINLRYYQVWHGKTAAEKELLNMHVEACNQLPWFCERIRESNPGSVITLATSADSKFRIFVSLHASLYGFQHGCRPLVFLDRIPLRNNNELKLLVAAALDGDDGIFPVGFAAVEADTYDTWLWFLEQLKFAIGTSRTITFVSNRQNRLDEAVPHVFENSHHSYCLIDLVQDLKADLKKGSWSEEVKDAMINDFGCAAQACLVEEFNAHIENISNVSKYAADWVVATKPEHWSNAFFMGSRYNHVSADIVEFNDWISIKQEASVILMMDAICSKVMEMICTRRESSDKWEGTLTPSMEQELKKERPQPHKFTVLCSSDTVFEVRGSAVNVVNIGSWECTCRRWQIIGLPCMHAIVVLDHLGRSLYDYCSQFFRVDCYRATYSQSVHQIPDVERIISISGANLYPPHARQLKWPRRKRDRRKKGDVRALHCSLCKGAGHNKATCEAPISMHVTKVEHESKLEMSIVVVYCGQHLVLTIKSVCSEL